MRPAVNNNNNNNYQRHNDSNNGLSLLLYSTKAVFSNKIYVSLGIVVATIFWLISNISNQLLFLSPSLTFYWPIPESSIPSFVLSSIIAALTGMVVAMTVHLYIQIRSTYKTNHNICSNNIKNKEAVGRRHYRRTSLPSLLVFISSLGVVSSVCASCSYSAGLFLIASVLGGGSTSGMIGSAAASAVPASGATTTTAILASLVYTYHIPLQLVSLGLLIWSYYYSARKMWVVTANSTARTNNCS